MFDMKIGDTLLIYAMPKSTKIIVDENISSLIPKLKEAKCTNVYTIEKLGLELGSKDSSIIKKLKEKATDKSKFLLLTRNGKDFLKAARTETFKLLWLSPAVDVADPNFIKFLCGYLSVHGKDESGALKVVKKKGSTTGYETTSV